MQMQASRPGSHRHRIGLKLNVPIRICSLDGLSSLFLVSHIHQLDVLIICSHSDGWLLGGVLSCSAFKLVTDQLCGEYPAVVQSLGDEACVHGARSALTTDLHTELTQIEFSLAQGTPPCLHAVNQRLPNMHMKLHCSPCS